jgi:TctA family transporter
MTGSLIIAALLVVAVCYAHAEIPRFTKGTTHRTVAHVVLIVVGCACGAVSWWIPGLSSPRWLAVVVGFGVVHVPAAAILLIKYLRGSSQS